MVAVPAVSVTVQTKVAGVMLFPLESSRSAESWRVSELTTIGSVSVAGES